METFTDAASYALRFINQTNRSVFLTGRAGTGKTTLLREIIRSTHKNTVVVAPTGIAALNAGGVTIHSMFQLPFAAFIPDQSAPGRLPDDVKFETRETLRRHFRLSAFRQSVIRNMELLIIDEVSMLRADLLDAIDFMLRFVRKNNAPFGGVQLLFIGDLLQLPPVIGNIEWNVLSQYYSGKFFFHSHAIAVSPPVYIELSKIYRQTDDKFISILNNLRDNIMTQEDVGFLNQFVDADFDPKKNIGSIVLTTHNVKADAINNSSLETLPDRSVEFYPEIVGDFPEKLFPVDEKLKLKVGAQVMFVKNDPSAEKNYFNGKTGVIKSLSENEIMVHFPDEGKTIEAERYEWKNIRYRVDENSREITEEILGTFTHYPLRLAWAITVHKSQGLTFDKAAIDVSDVFAPGQAYVALSRLRSLNGLILLSPLKMKGISGDGDVVRFAENRADEQTLGKTLENETLIFVRDFLAGSFTWNSLFAEWKNHLAGYGSEKQKSEKAKNKFWAAGNTEILEKVASLSNKFRSELTKLFSSETRDGSVICSRVNAAYEYFFPILDGVLDSLMWKLEEVSRAKKSKGFFDELSQLEELLTGALLQLMKAKRLAEIFGSGNEITKENLITPAMNNYRRGKIEAVSAKFRAENVFSGESRSLRKDGKKLPKKDTVSETYELWLAKNPIGEIAELRKLTKQTIATHMAKLIQSKAVSIFDVLPEDKVIELARAFVGYNEESLNGMKEKFGNKFTWDELKLFKASIDQPSQ